MANEIRYTNDTSNFGGGECEAADYSNYRCISEHGTHRLGVVQRFDRFFFVKSLAESYKGMHLYRMQLQKEFKLLLSLSHPGIVRVYDLVDIPGVGLSILMEYVSGVTLGEWLERKPPKSERRKVAEALLDAVEALHKEGAVHRDLKPDNIMVTPAAEVRIIDFGFCDAGSYAMLKQPSGTVGFAAPEQMEKGYEPRPACDVYALGLLIKMLSPGFTYRLAAKEALRPNPDKRPSDARKLRLCIGEKGRKLRAGFLTMALSAVAFGVVIFVCLAGSADGRKMEITAGKVISTEATPTDENISASEESMNNSSEIPKEMTPQPVEEAGGNVEETDKLLDVLHKDIDSKLQEKCNAIVKEMRALRADPEMSLDWRLFASTKMINELDAYYAELVNPLTTPTENNGKHMYASDAFAWDTFKSGKTRKEILNLRDSMQSDLKASK